MCLVAKLIARKLAKLWRGGQYNNFTLGRDAEDSITDADRRGVVGPADALSPQLAARARVDTRYNTAVPPEKHEVTGRHHRWHVRPRRSAAQRERLLRIGSV